MTSLLSSRNDILIHQSAENARHIAKSVSSFDVSSVSSSTYLNDSILSNSFSSSQLNSSIDVQSQRFCMRLMVVDVSIDYQNRVQKVECFQPEYSSNLNGNSAKRPTISVELTDDW